MANTNIKLFDENKSNMMSDIDYGKDTQRANGVQTGVASSQLQNKFQYQMSLMAYAVAQLMIANGYDAMDSAVVSTFVGNFSNSVVQKVKDKASASEAAAGTNDLKWISAKQLVDVATTIANKAAEGMVKYNTPQTLTDAQKQQARDNINAPAPYEAGDNISITGRVITTKAFPCNPNLLDNWYFGNPVNQRGQTSYTGKGYGIDRFTNDGQGGNVIVGDGFVSFQKTGKYTSPIQFFENNRVPANQTVTISAIVNDDLFFATGTLESRVTAVCTGGRFEAYRLGGSGVFRFIFTGSGVYRVKAVKMELGSQQTLAHQENGAWVLNEIPDYGEQLRRCQRYYYRAFYGQYQTINMAYEDTAYAFVMVPIPVAMRIDNPVLTQSKPILLGSSEKIMEGAEARGCMVRLAINYAAISNAQGGVYSYCSDIEGVTFELSADL